MAIEGKKRILVVEDEYLMAEVIRKWLMSLGYDVVWAENGQEALQRLRDGVFDLVLMDEMMPVKDGFETTREIRMDQKFSRLPVIFLTMRALAEDRRKAQAAGASDYLTKPFEAETLATLIKKWT